jgi:glycosyltransferase involved in cell wall biosynthesis
MKYTEIPILVYHDISDVDNPWCVSPDNFVQQMNFLKENNYRTISLGELKHGIEKGKETDEKLVVITFDDGRKGVFTYAFPLLKNLSFHANIFVVPEWVAGKIPPSENYSEFMDWQNLRELVNAGFKIGSHSLSHKNLTTLRTEDLSLEINESKKIITKNLHCNVSDFSYPFGKTNAVTVDETNKYYDVAVSMEDGFAREAGKFSRQSVLRNTSLHNFGKLLFPPMLSLCMIVKDEENYLSNCLNSVKDLVDEIIIVDTGSSDKTKEIASTFSERIFDFSWCDDFAAARNEALKHATGDWILVLDADEVVAEPDLKLIKSAINNWDISGYRIMSRNYNNDSSVQGWRPIQFENASNLTKSFRGWYPSLKVRLFQRKKEFFFKGRIHEMVDQSILANEGKILALPISIHHYGEERGNKSGKYLELTKKKIEENPDAKAYFELGIQHKQLGQLELAEKAIQRSLELDDHHLTPLLNLALVQQKRGRMGEAIGNYQKVLERNSSNASACFGLGFCYFKKSQLEDALRWFVLALKYNPYHIDAHINLGAIYEKMGDLPKALDVIKQALRMDPQNARAYHNLGVVFEKMVNPQMALRSYQQAINLGYNRVDLPDRIKKIADFLEK